MKIKWILFSNIYYVTLQWLVLSLLSKVYMPDDVGEYFFALALATPVMTFFALKLTGFVIASKDEVYSKDEYRFIRLFYSVLSGIFILTLSTTLVSEDVSFYVMLFVICFKITEQYDDVEASFKSKELKFKQFSLVKIRRGTAYLCTVGLSSYLNDDFHNALFLATILYSIYWIIFNFNSLRRVTKVSKCDLIFIFKKMYPMGMSGAIQSLGTSGCRLYIGVLLGKTLLAVFGSISYSITAINIVTNALGGYFLPFFSKYKNYKSKFYKEIFKSQMIILFLTFILLVMVYFLGERLLLIAFNQEVAKYNDGLLVLSLSAAIKASTNLLGSAIVSTEKYSYQVFLTSINLVSLVVLIYLLTPYGIYGMFYATLISSFIEWILMVFISFRYFNAFFKEVVV